MLGEMGDASLLFRFVAGASADEDSNAHRMAVSHSAGDYPQTVIEHTLVVHFQEFYFALHAPSTYLCCLLASGPSYRMI